MRNLAIVSLTLASFLFIPSCTAEASMGTEATIKGYMQKITAAVATVKDDATAKNANTTITDLVGKISTTLTGAKTMPGDAMKKITDMIATEKKAITEKINALAPELKKQLQPALDALAKLN